MMLTTFKKKNTLQNLGFQSTAEIVHHTVFLAELKQ